MFNILILVLMFTISTMSGITIADGAALNPNPPANPAGLIFIHHSVGENWLCDSNGGLGIAMRDNNYFVSDTNYGWGPGIIGDYTDIGQWWLWFRGPDSQTYLNALYNEGEQNASYSRLSTKPSGENQIIMFKSCFPNSNLLGNPTDQVPSINDNQLKGQSSGSEYHTVANAKGIYIDILEYFSTRQDKLFIAITASPLSDASMPDNARAFNEWLVNDWLKSYPYKNVAVFDFYNILTTNGGNPNINDLNQNSGNHHRWWNNAIQHKIDGDDDSYPNILEYPGEGDDHPSIAGNLKATGEFLPLLNIYYNCWKGTGGCTSEAVINPIQADLKANNSDGPVTISTSNVLSVTASLNAGSSSGTNADWWVAAGTPFGWYYYVYPDSWNYAPDLNNFLPAYQGSLFNLSPVEVLNITGLPAGTYVFYFGVDTVMNGQLDFDHLYYDSVVVNIM